MTYVTHYVRHNIEKNLIERHEIRRENYPWGEWSHLGLNRFHALEMVNNWNRIASLTEASKWRYWV